FYRPKFRQTGALLNTFASGFTPRNKYIAPRSFKGCSYIELRFLNLTIYKLSSFQNKYYECLKEQIIQSQRVYYLEKERSGFSDEQSRHYLQRTRF
ncbi:MAG: hypothetical protein ACI9QN_001797, partial [Arcticibacterium sp.]